MTWKEGTAFTIRSSNSSGECNVWLLQEEASRSELRIDLPQIGEGLSGQLKPLKPI